MLIGHINVCASTLTWSPGGIMRLIMLVPLPLAICSDLISFFTFQISTFLSELSSLLAVDILSIRPEETRL